jgi:hypothetical protein
MTQNEKTSYNGWSNYKTWAVNLWLTNKQASYTHWGERAREVLSVSGEDNNGAIATLASEIKENIEEECSKEGASLAVLMNSSLGHVDWHEIARSFVEVIATTLPRKVVPLGMTVATPGALNELTNQDRIRALIRHARGDWGDVDPDDWAENELSLTEGFRLLSSYHSEDGVKFWIITEADRSVTTILLPSEY